MDGDTHIIMVTPILDLDGITLIMAGVLVLIILDGIHHTTAGGDMVVTDTAITIHTTTITTTHTTEYAQVATTEEILTTPQTQEITAETVIQEAQPTVPADAVQTPIITTPLTTQILLQYFLEIVVQQLIVHIIHLLTIQVEKTTHLLNHVHITQTAIIILEEKTTAPLLVPIVALLTIMTHTLDRVPDHQVVEEVTAEVAVDEVDKISPLFRQTLKKYYNEKTHIYHNSRIVV
jgi:hypothetical protein